MFPIVRFFVVSFSTLDIGEGRLNPTFIYHCIQETQKHIAIEETHLNTPHHIYSTQHALDLN